VPQAVWTGQLSFGLVNIPVKLYSATAPKDVRFHQYDARSGRRVHYRRVTTGPMTQGPLTPPQNEAPPHEEEQGGAPPERAEAETPDEPAYGEPDPGGLEVPWEEIVKGFEIEPCRVVTVTPEELASVAPERSRLLEVESFVPLSAIDPVYFEKSYYVAPQPGAAAAARNRYVHCSANLRVSAKTIGTSG
jgi:DNA end-binding protein Ku